ncbi:MAG TPA: DUF3788 domain-containing protein [bacterium]
MNKFVKTPTDKDMLKLVGRKAALWTELRVYIAEHYDHSPILSVGKKDYDWTIRYRKSGKTLVSLMPEKNEFCVLVVLGREEVAKVKTLKLGQYTKGIFQNAKQFHDGKWLWLRPGSKTDLEDIKALLSIKRKPH